MVDNRCTLNGLKIWRKAAGLAQNQTTRQICATPKARIRKGLGLSARKGVVDKDI